MILSAQFWPSFREGKLELPEAFQKALEKYTKAFEALKGNRTLNWKTHLGESQQLSLSVSLFVSVYSCSILPQEDTQKPSFTVRFLAGNFIGWQHARTNENTGIFLVSVASDGQIEHVSLFVTTGIVAKILDQTIG